MSELAINEEAEEDIVLKTVVCVLTLFAWVSYNKDNKEEERCAI